MRTERDFGYRFSQINNRIFTAETLRAQKKEIEFYRRDLRGKNEFLTADKHKLTRIKKDRKQGRVG